MAENKKTGIDGKCVECGADLVYYMLNGDVYIKCSNDTCETLAEKITDPAVAIDVLGTLSRASSKLQRWYEREADEEHATNEFMHPPGDDGSRAYIKGLLDAHYNPDAARVALNRWVNSDIVHFKRDIRKQLQQEEAEEDDGDDGKDAYNMLRFIAVLGCVGVAIAIALIFTAMGNVVMHAFGFVLFIIMLFIFAYTLVILDKCKYRPGIDDEEAC